MPNTNTNRPQPAQSKSANSLTSRLVKQMRDLNVCVSGCEGRCRVCPQNVVRDAALLLESQEWERDRLAARVARLEDALLTVQMAINEALTGFPRPITDYKDVVNTALRGQS